MKPDSAKPDHAPQELLSVGELSSRIKLLVENDIGWVRVQGEASTVRIPASGHCYFMLKDEDACINAVCFRANLSRAPIRPVEGMKLELSGRITAYTQRSQYQIIVESLRESGLGELMRRFLALKEKLRTEGLFDADRKKPLPRVPSSIGVVTSMTGAALQDILNILSRRAPGTSVYITPTSVQGDAAPAEIVQALNLMNRHAKTDVIILGRGGGSLEDLWAFNEESVVRAIRESRIPLISAVGHETDTTLSDYAADLSAPTPSAAAELVCAHHADLLENLVQLERRARRGIDQLIDQYRIRLDRCIQSWGLRSPRERLTLAGQRLDDLLEQVTARMRERLYRNQTRLENMGGRLAGRTPIHRILMSRSQIDGIDQRLQVQVAGHIDRLILQVSSLAKRLVSVGPDSILKRGYSIVTRDRRGELITHPDDVREGDIVQVQSAGGKWKAAALHQENDFLNPQ
jgi:exodeoxyribonuclease VII large subunit